MSKPQIDLSPDLKRLRDEGYDIEVRPRYLLVKSVPHVNASREVRQGTLVSELNWAGDVTAPPSTHVAYFIGDVPCHKDGTEIAEIRHQAGRQELDKDLIVDRSFSAKPTEGPYPNFYEKMKRYVVILSGPAEAIKPGVAAQVYPVIECAEEESVFNYFDTASSRAGISAVTRKLELGKVAIVGVGGTGSYMLDLVAKTPVKEIHLFDGDTFLNHNAFRAPGAPSVAELRTKPNKAAYFRDVYSKMRRGIVAHEFFITAENVEELKEMEFVFLSMDGGGNKRTVVERLKAVQIPFIDVGMGLELIGGAIGGLLTLTSCSKAKNDHLDRRISFVDGAGENDYARNIQVADLNALNAALAVVKWKKIVGFYHDFVHEHFNAYTLDGNKLANEECG